MKKLFLTLAVAFCTFFTVNAQSTTEEPKVDPNAPVITFDSETVDYGVIPHKSDPYREFNFTNTGKDTLKISYCKGSCGCTVPKCPQTSIAPGAKGKIKVRYDTNRVGKFTKSVTVLSNASNSPKVIHITGTVSSPPPPPQPDSGN